MRPQDIKIGVSYRHRSSPNYGYAKAVKILKPKQLPNTHTYTIVVCEQSVERDPIWGIIKYYRPCDLEAIE